MQSWVFRNRRRLEGIYARRHSGSAQDQVSVLAGPGAAEAAREGLRICVLFPSRGRILPAA